MKTNILSLLLALMIPAISSAKIEDFNAMIAESSQAQSRLRNELMEQTDSTHQAQMKAPKVGIEVASEYGNSMNIATKKSLLTFEKEMVHYRPSEPNQMKRLATEIQAADKTF